MLVIPDLINRSICIYIYIYIYIYMHFAHAKQYDSYVFRHWLYIVI